MGTLSELEQEQWSETMGKSKDWVVWCRSREKDQEQRPFEVDGKKIFSNRSKKTNPKQERRRIRKEAKGSQFAGKRGGDRATSNAQ